MIRLVIQVIIDMKNLVFAQRVGNTEIEIEMTPFLLRNRK